ncbi:MAG: prephenate dehydrogenase [Bryobacteraceae bacterium]|nr:prephenate dehydrogenase [Bryobacteraceae bacterium]
MIETIAIAGVGLIGGSFGLALRSAGFGGRIWGVSSPATIEAARARGAIDEGVSLEQAAHAADVLYLAQPISRILETIEALGPLARPGALITDAGSTKSAIVEKARVCLPGAHFLGGHPMAGKEARGVEAAEADLFRGRPYLLTPAGPEAREAGVTKEFVGWLEKIGARIDWLAADQHDRLVAAASHGPQLVSTALAAALAARPDAAAVAAVAGPGLTDMTRLALSSFEIWRDILATNHGEVAPVLKELELRISDLRKKLETGELVSDFETAAGFANLLRNRDSNR